MNLILVDSLSHVMYLMYIINILHISFIAVKVQKRSVGDEQVTLAEI